MPSSTAKARIKAKAGSGTRRGDGIPRGWPVVAWIPRRYILRPQRDPDAREALDRPMAVRLAQRMLAVPGLLEQSRQGLRRLTGDRGPRRSRTTKMTIVTRTVRPRNRPMGAPAATGHPEPLAAPASPVVGAVWPTRNDWSIRGQASRRAMIRMRPIAEEMTCHQENGFVGALWRTRRRRNAWTRIATTKLTKRTRNRSPTSGSKTPNALGSVPPEAPPPGIASPPVSRFATLKASAATSTIARNRSSGTAHSAFPRHMRITFVRRRRALITVSRTPAGVERSRDAELLEELRAAPLADELQGEGDETGSDGEDECEDSDPHGSAEHVAFRGRRRGVVSGCGGEAPEPG